MSDPHHLSVAIRGWKGRVDLFWESAVERVPERLRLVAAGKAREGAAAIETDLLSFIIARPAETAAHFGVLAPTLDAAVTDKKSRPADSLGIYAVSLASIANAFECIGRHIDDATWATIRDWLPRFEVSRDDQRVSPFWTVGLTAMALGDRPTYLRIAGHSGSGPVPFRPRETFQMNLRGFLLHLVGAIEARASAADVLPGFTEVLNNYERYANGKALDEGALLYIARIVHHHIGGKPLGTTAQFLHDTIWELAGEPG
jgi:hypothetical protein